MIAEITAAIGFLRMVKDAYDSLADKDEEATKAQEAIDHLLSAKEEMLDLRKKNLDQGEEIIRLQQRLAEVLEQKAVSETPALRRQGDVYMWDDPPQGRSEGPYCVACFERDSRPIGLVRNTHRLFRRLGTHMCPVCETHVNHRVVRQEGDTEEG